MDTRAKAVVVALAAAALSASACGDDDESRPGSGPREESSHRPAKPPHGWRTVRNRRAGFTLSVPRTWLARTRGPATLIRSDDQLVSATVAADRTAGEREGNPKAFGRRTIKSLPGFRGRISRRAGRIPGTPYRTARVEARGRVANSRVVQRITAAVFQRPRRAIYEVLVFRNAKVRPRFNDPVVERMLRSFRAQAPDFTP